MLIINKIKNATWLEKLEKLLFTEVGPNLCISKIDVNSDYYDVNYENRVRNPKFNSIYHLHEIISVYCNDPDTALTSLYEIERELLSASMYRKILFFGYDENVHKILSISISSLVKNISIFRSSMITDDINDYINQRYDSTADFLKQLNQILICLNEIEEEMANNHMTYNDENAGQMRISR